MRRLGTLALRLFASDWWLAVLVGLYFLVLWPFVPGLGSTANLANVLQAMLPLLVVSVGQAIVLITGGIDLAATGVIALASVTGAMAMTGGFPWPGGAAGGAAAMLGVGAVVGLGNGLAVSRLKMPAFVVTLTAMMFLGGLAVFVTGSRSIHGLPSGFVALGQGSLGPVTFPLLIVGALAVGAHLALRRLVIGRWLYAIGQNARTAEVSGVPVAAVVTTAYVVSGLSAAVAAIIYTARLETGSPILGQRIFLDVIAAAVIGGASLFGGRGSVLGVTLGVLFITLVDNSFSLLGLSSFTVLIAKGALILVAAGLDTLRIRVAGGRR